MSIRKLSNGPTCGWLTHKRKMLCVSMSGHLEGFKWKKITGAKGDLFSLIYNLLLKHFLFFSFYSNLLISVVFSYFWYFLFFSSFLSISSVLPEGKKDRDKKATKEKGLTKTTSGGPRGPGKLYYSVSYSSFSSSSVRPVIESSLFEVYLLSTLTRLLYSFFLSSWMKSWRLSIQWNWVCFMKFSVVEFYWKLPSFNMLSLSSVLWPIITWLAWAISVNNILYFSYNIFAR